MNRRWPSAALLALPVISVSAQAQGSAASSSATSSSATSPTLPDEAFGAATTVPENLLLALVDRTSASTAAAAPLGIANPPNPAGSNPVGDAAKLPQPAFGAIVKRASATAIEFTAPDRIFSGRLDFASGSEMFRPDQHMLSGSLTSGNSWRREVSVSLANPDPEAVGLTLTAGAHTGRRPMLAGGGIRHGVGELTRWLQSQSWTFGAKIDLPDSGIHYANGFSRSQFSLDTASRLDRLDWLLTGKPHWRGGGSQWHKFNADLWKGAGGQASVYAFYGTMDLDYQSYQSRSDTPLIYDGTTFELGGEITRGRSKLSFSHSSNDGAYLAFDETTAGLKTGAFDLKLVNGSTTYRDQDQLGWWVRNSYWRGNARLSLKALFGGGFGSGLLPGEASFRFERLRGVSSSLPTLAKERTKLGFGLTWSGKNTKADIYVSRVITDRPASLVSGPSREEELVVDFNGYLSGEGWDLSYYGSIGDQDGPYSSNSNLSGGVDFSLSDKNRPKLSFGVDFNRFDLRSYQYGLRDRSFSVNAKLDLTQYMPLTPTGQKPYLIVKAYGDWSKSRITGEREDNRLDPTIMLTFGTKF